jgi:hypothetical protein
MDTTKSIIRQVDVTIGIRIARFLAVHLQDLLGQWDVCVMSVLLILISHLVTEENQVVLLGRRLSCLLLLEKITPVLRAVVGYHVGVQTAMLDVGLLVLLSAVPKSFQEGSEGAIIYTSVVYVFVGMVGDSPPVWMAPLSLAAIVWASRQEPGSHLWGQFLMIVGIVCTSNLTTIIANDTQGLQPDAMLLKMCVELVMLGGALQMSVAESTYDFLLYNMASTIEPVVRGEVVPAFMLLLFLERFLGWGVWVTRVVLLVFVGLVVDIVLTYIAGLAATDTILTLKVSALVLQFLLHEIGIVLIR